MNKFKLTKEEQGIEDHIDEYGPPSTKKQKLLNQALAKLRRERAEFFAVLDQVAVGLRRHKVEPTDFLRCIKS